jgi:Beta-lactamase enzyme family
MKKNLIYLLLMPLYAISQANNAAKKAKPNFLEELMLNSGVEFREILKNKEKNNLQIIYTQIDRDKTGNPNFTNFTYNINKEKYFYPASTVKMPIAFLALEKLNELNINGLDMNTTMIIDSSNEGEDAVYSQPLAEDSRPTIANYIKQIFLVSDNDAYNRLYEFLGQEYIMKKLAEKGYPDAVIRHRLQKILTTNQNSKTNTISFYDKNGELIYKQPAQHNKKYIASLKVKIGKGYFNNDVLINQPFDFSLKNRVYLQDLHSILQSVIFPNTVNLKKRFLFTEKDYKFVKQCLSSYPSESHFPPYDTSIYWDAYCKFLYFGSEKKLVDTNIRIFNKVGDAYGFLTDVAYLVDTSNNIEFMLSATILCNNDEIFNDDNYDYETIGLPFMKNLGRLIYDVELKRTKKYLPNLSALFKE